MRRAMWQDRDVELKDTFEFKVDADTAPEGQAELNDLKRLLNRAFADVLTQKQREVAVALIVDGVPIDVFSERVGSNRNAVYKTLHDVRKKLREYLSERGINGLESLGGE